ncbi:hypothetical protein L6452_15450 [Arctium lappa]|uniref:Uncharacterized protein n=1 Tax=Arctium lappa TaxID=4217 RepID=A0ACB9CNK9_ARCLA|nr:hypothetical protein L6452_15450 [Arctium lappa]
MFEIKTSHLAHLSSHIETSHLAHLFDRNHRFVSAWLDYEPLGETPIRCESDVPSKMSIERLRAMPLENLMEEFRENHSKGPKISVAIAGALNEGVEGKASVVTTGGLGFVGSALCLELLRRGARLVRAFDLRSSSPWSDHLLKNGVHFVKVVVWTTIQSHGGVGEQMGRNGDAQESLWKSNPSTLTPPLSPICTMGHGR